MFEVHVTTVDVVLGSTLSRSSVIVVVLYICSSTTDQPTTDRAVKVTAYRRSTVLYTSIVQTSVGPSHVRQVLLTTLHNFVVACE